MISCTCIFYHILSSIFLYFPIFSSCNFHILYVPMIFIYCAFHILYFHMLFIYFIYHIHFSFQVIYIFLLVHINMYLSLFTYHHIYQTYIHICTYIKLILVSISRKSYRTYTYMEVLIHVLILLSILYLFYGAYTCTTELIHVQRYP